MKSPQPRKGIWGPRNPAIHPDFTGSINCPNVDDGYSSIMAWFYTKSKPKIDFSQNFETGLNFLLTCPKCGRGWRFVL
jgi:hypothetical protein